MFTLLGQATETIQSAMVELGAPPTLSSNFQGTAPAFQQSLGTVPLMPGTGTGSEIRQPFGYAMVGGLIVSQALTLFTTPVVYLYLDRLSDFFSGWGRMSRAANRRRSMVRSSRRRSEAQVSGNRRGNSIDLADLVAI